MHGDIVLLNVVVAIANADLNCRMQIGSCSNLNLMFRGVTWAGIVRLSFMFVSEDWIEGVYWLSGFTLLGFPLEQISELAT